MNFYEYLVGHVGPEDANSVAIVSRNETVTYGELLALADRVARTLREAGAGPGDRVGIQGENSAYWVASYLGILKLGAVAAPFPARLNTERLTRLAELTGCAAVCADAQRARQYAAHLPAGCAVIVPPVTGSDELLAAAARIVPLTEDDAPCPTAAVDERSDLAALMFTSGSTGEPNAVRVTHRNLMANTASIVDYLGLTAEDRTMVVLPFDYCFGLSLLHTHLHVGGSLALNNASQFTEDVLDDMERFACSGFAGVPAVYQNFLRRSTMAKRELPALRLVQQAGGKLPDALISEFREALPHVRLFVMYGQTEATSRLSYLPPERLDDKLGSIGRGIPGVTLRVLDAEGRPVAPGEIGEIVAEGENVTQGYWVPDPEKHNFRDGKLYTGDIGRVDEEGFIYLVGRASDFIKPAGHRISTKEIEDVLAEIPELVEAAVVGMPDPDLGEAAKAFIVTRDGSELPYIQIVGHCKRRLPPYAVPRQVVYVAELPKSGSQKVLKRALVS